MSETAAETSSGPTYQLSSVNVDSLKEVLGTLATAFPFIDETAKNAFATQLDSLHLSGNPHEAPVSSDAKDQEIADLKAQLAALEQGNPGQ